jgi:hypothetical protein
MCHGIQFIEEVPSGGAGGLIPRPIPPHRGRPAQEGSAVAHWRKRVLDHRLLHGGADEVLATDQDETSPAPLAESTNSRLIDNNPVRP